MKKEIVFARGLNTTKSYVASIRGSNTGYLTTRQVEGVERRLEGKIESCITHTAVRRRDGGIIVLKDK